MSEKWYTFKGQAWVESLWEWAILVILLQKCRASITKYRRQRTEVRAKGIDPPFHRFKGPDRMSKWSNTVSGIL